LSNEQTNGSSSDTERTDYPALFLDQLRLELAAIGKRLEELGERLPWATVAERRSICFRIAEHLEVLGDKATDAAGVTRDHVAALTLYLSSKR
jgi:hypothetical protein